MCLCLRVVVCWSVWSLGGRSVISDGSPTERCCSLCLFVCACFHVYVYLFVCVCVCVCSSFCIQQAKWQVMDRWMVVCVCVCVFEILGNWLELRSLSVSLPRSYFTDSREWITHWVGFDPFLAKHHKGCGWIPPSKPYLSSLAIYTVSKMNKLFTLNISASHHIFHVRCKVRQILTAVATSYKA